MRVARKFIPRAAANLFFNRFSRDIIFSSWAFFAVFDSCFLFVCLFVWCSLKLKMYILIHIRLCGRVEKISSGWFQDYFFIDLTDGRGKKTTSQILPHMSNYEKLFTFIPYLKKIENHINHMTQFDTWHTLSSLDISNFLTDISMSRYQKIQL